MEHSLLPKVLSVPAGQAGQCPDPRGLDLPGGQESQLIELAAALNLPLGHCAQELSGLTVASPGWHTLHSADPCLLQEPD